MAKLKTMGVVAAVLLCGSSVFANNFRGGDQVYVPAAGHLSGASGTFISDLFLSNFSASDSVDVSVIFSQTANTGGTPNIKTFKPVCTASDTNCTVYKVTLAPKERREIVDFIAAPISAGGLGQTAAFGDLVINGCLAGQDCTPDPNTGTNSNFRNISAESRVYQVAPGANQATAPTTGQLFSGFGWYSYASSDANAAGLDKVFMTGFRANSNYRSNLGIVNASQFSTTVLTATMYDGASQQQIGTTQNITLGPLGFFQGNVANMFGFSGTNAYVVVQQQAGTTTPTSDAAANGCPNGCPAFFAYGSVLDNQSGDATTLEPQYTVPLSDNAVNCIYNLTCNSKTGFNPHRAARH